MSGKNLFNIQLDYLIAPKRVLKNQAEHLSQLSDETIVAYVETARGSQGMDDCFTHSFHIRVPKLSYRAQLFEVTHGIDMYPIQVRNDDWTYEQECPDAVAFEAAVADILNSPETKTRLEALRSQAFAEMEQQPQKELDNARHTPALIDSVEPSDEPMVESTEQMEPEPESTLEESQPEESSSEQVVEEDVDALLEAEPEAPAEQVSQELELDEDYFVEWGDPIPFDKDNVGMCPAEPGAAIIYTDEGSPLFIAYNKDIQAGLKRQLGRKASPLVSKARKAGLLFVCGTVRSIDEAEQIIQSRVNTMPFRAMLGDPDSSDWI